MSLAAWHNPQLASGTSAVAAARGSIALSPCECCGGTRHEGIATRRGVNLRRCRDCGLVFAFPVPSQRTGKSSSSALNVPTDAALVMDNMLIRHGIASGKFLEIGWGEDKPSLASMSRLHWDVRGVAIDGSPELFQAANFAANSFDVIYLGGGVIGNVASPRKLLADARRILRPRGLLVIRTPNARSGFAMLTLAAARVAHGSWVHSQAPQRLHEFTRKSLRTLVESTGYQIAWNRAEAGSGLLPADGSKGFIDRLALMPVHALGAVLDVLSRGGSEIFLGARKPQHGALNS